MSSGGKIKLVFAIALLILLFCFFSNTIGIENAWFMISNFTSLIPFIIAGLFMVLCGISEGKWGKIIFSAVSLISLLYGFAHLN